MVSTVSWCLLGEKSHLPERRAPNEQPLTLRPPSVPTRRSRRPPEVLVDPVHPPPLHITLAHRIDGVVARLWVADEAGLHAVVLERVVELEGLRRRDSVVARVGHDERRRANLRGE